MIDELKENMMKRTQAELCDRCINCQSNFDKANRRFVIGGVVAAGLLLPSSRAINAAGVLIGAGFIANACLVMGKAGRDAGDARVLARLLGDNFDHLQCFICNGDRPTWMTLGLKKAAFPAVEFK